jgi:CheY-like chemotaxis protein
MQPVPSGKYLIYAEDDLDDREIFEDMMKNINEGIGVVSVDDGSQVLSFLASLQPSDYLPCFILLDINMPIMDGYATLRALKRNPLYEHITVIMYSTASAEIENQSSMSFGASKFITKPFSMVDLEEITRTFAEFCDITPLQRKGKTI